MINLRKALQSHLTSLTASSVYFQTAPDTAVYPYVVYDFQVYDVDEGQTVALDIDTWDDKADTTALDTLAAAVDVNKAVISTTELTIIFFRENRIPLTDEDPNIKRRKYSYAGKLHERS